jgi:hypothetical protein
MRVASGCRSIRDEPHGPCFTPTAASGAMARRQPERGTVGPLGTPSSASRQAHSLATKSRAGPTVRAARDPERVAAGETATGVHRRALVSSDALMVSASLRNRVSHVRQRGRPRVARVFQAWPQRAQTRHCRSFTSTVRAAVSSFFVVISNLTYVVCRVCDTATIDVAAN